MLQIWVIINCYKWISAHESRIWTEVSVCSQAILVCHDCMPGNLLCGEQKLLNTLAVREAWNPINHRGTDFFFLYIFFNSSLSPLSLCEYLSPCYLLLTPKAPTNWSGVPRDEIIVRQ